MHAPRSDRGGAASSASGSAVGSGHRSATVPDDPPNAERDSNPVPSPPMATEVARRFTGSATRSSTATSSRPTAGPRWSMPAYPPSAPSSDVPARATAGRCRTSTPLCSPMRTATISGSAEDVHKAGVPVLIHPTTPSARPASPTRAERRDAADSPAPRDVTAARHGPRNSAIKPSEDRRGRTTRRGRSSTCRARRARSTRPPLPGTWFPLTGPSHADRRRHAVHVESAHGPDGAAVVPTRSRSRTRSAIESLARIETIEAGALPRRPAAIRGPPASAPRSPARAPGRAGPAIRSIPGLRNPSAVRTKAAEPRGCRLCRGPHRSARPDGGADTTSRPWNGRWSPAQPHRASRSLSAASPRTGRARGS